MHDNISIGPKVKIGKNSIIESGCIVSNCVIGDNCYIQSGSVIGDKGFGFTYKSKVSIQHIGNVLIGNNVHIGSNTTIDRAALDSTIIANNVRIDNLVQVAHGVSIGENTIIAAQSGIAGSSIIGNNCIIGGQAGISGHLIIGSNVTIAAKSGVTKNIQNNSIVAGFPAIDIKKWKKMIIKNHKEIK
jgi:UDP-3-O-[3-hydroxymyristoyl] glucosamine N-acyltransferase